MDGAPEARAAYFREVAQTLRGIADQIRFDLRRKNQILALSEGFDRFADRLERAVVPDTKQQE
jgi:hypothetical protein